MQSGNPKECWVDAAGQLNSMLDPDRPDASAVERMTSLCP